MNESDLAVDEAADKDLLRFGDGSQDRIYASTFWVRPPTAPDRLAANSLAKAGCACFGRGEDDAMLSDEGKCIRSGGACVHGAQRSTRTAAKKRSFLDARFDERLGGGLGKARTLCVRWRIAAQREALALKLNLPTAQSLRLA